MNVSALSVRYPLFLGVALLISVVWGMTALVQLPRQEEPALTWRLANVVTRLPGSSPARMESLVTDVLEKFVEEVDEVEHVYSVSRAGVSLLQIELRDDVVNAPPVWQKVRHKLSEASSELPEDVIGPDLDDEIMGTFAQLIAITGKGASYRQLKDQAEQLEEQLRYLPMTASTQIFGVQPEEILVELDPAKLAAYRLSFHAIADAISARNTRRPSGRVTIEGSELLIEASGEFARDAELREMVLMVSRTGSSVRLRDVAHIRRTTQQPPEPLARVDGTPAVVVGARARQRVRIDHFGAEVSQTVKRFQQQLPVGIQCTVIHDLARSTRQLAEQLTWTLLLSVAFVFMSTALFMGLRPASVVTLAIPVTGLIVLICFAVLGIPLNQMSVMAIIMAFGLLVDNAIVVTEQIHRTAFEEVAVNDGDVQGDRSVMDAVRRAAAEQPALLSAPLVVSTLTTTAAFVPIYLLPGGTGEFVRAIPLGLTICLITSLLVAITVVPWLCTLLLTWRQKVRPIASSTSRLAEDNLADVDVSKRPGVQATLASSATANSSRKIARSSRHGWRLRTAGIAQAVGDGYRQLLVLSVRRPLRTLGWIVILMVAMSATGITLRRDFFSPVQRDQLVIDFFAPQGSSLSYLSELVDEAESVVAQDPEVRSTFAFVGRNAPLVFYNLQSQETYANHFAQMIVQVSNWQQTAQVAMRLQRQLDAKIVDAECVVHLLEHGAPSVAPFELRISGPELATLRELGRRGAQLLTETRGVRNTRNNFGNEAPKLVADVNESVARRVGVSQATVADELRFRADGLVASYVREDDERIPIRVRLPAESRANLDDLKSFVFKPTAGGEYIPFSAVAQLRSEWEVPSIYRRDGQRTLSVLAYPEMGLTAAQVSQRFIPALNAWMDMLPDGYHAQLGGENEQRREAESQLLGNAIYALFPILLLLMAEFGSLRLAGLILLIIPLSLAGALLGLFLTGWPLNFMAIMGMMILVGVVVNDAVILLDGFERRRRAGEPLSELVIAGTLERKRHVLITTVTTIAGFLPLAISPSLLWPPLAIAIIGGLAFSTLLTLAGIPAAYLLLMRAKG